MEKAASFNTHPEILEWFFKNGVKPETNENGETLLHHAAGANSNPQVLDVLIRHGFSPDEETADGWTPFLYAVVSNPNMQIVKFFSGLKGFDINKIYNINSSFDYIDSSLLDDLEPDVDMDHASIDAISLSSRFFDKETENCPSVFLSLLNPNIEIFKWFLDNGAQNITESVSALFKDGSIVKSKNLSLLHIAAKVKSDVRYLNFIVEKHGENAVHNTDSDGQNALHYASISNCNLDVYDWLLNKKIQINKKNRAGFTPFDLAVTHNKHPEVLSWYRDTCKALKHLRNRTINDLFLNALVYNSEPAIFQWFLDNDADINAVNKDGDTILHIVAQKDCPTDNILWMIANGAAYKAKNNAGKTALSCLKKRPDWPVIRAAIEDAKQNHEKFTGF
jgi:ankyrin repeat protein